MTVKQLMDLPLDPYERSVMSKEKIKTKLFSDYMNNIQQFIRLVELKENIPEKTLYVRMIVPSEIFGDKLMYDVCFLFHNVNTDLKSINPHDTTVQLYANAPAFMFTFAHIFYKNNLIDPSLKRYVSEIAIKVPPNKTNPKGLFGYDKSVFYALIYLTKNGFFGHYTTAVPMYKTMVPLMTMVNKHKEYEYIKKKYKQIYLDYKKKNSFSFF